MTDSIVGVLLAGISYDPEIRGVLVVTVAVLTVGQRLDILEAHQIGRASCRERVL